MHASQKAFRLERSVYSSMDSVTSQINRSEYAGSPNYHHLHDFGKLVRDGPSVDEVQDREEPRI